MMSVGLMMKYSEVNRIICLVLNILSSGLMMSRLRVKFRNELLSVVVIILFEWSGIVELSSVVLIVLDVLVWMENDSVVVNKVSM